MPEQLKAAMADVSMHWPHCGVHGDGPCDADCLVHEQAADGVAALSRPTPDAAMVERLRAAMLNAIGPCADPETRAWLPSLAAAALEALGQHSEGDVERGAQWRCVNCKWVTPMKHAAAPEKCAKCWCSHFAEVASLPPSARCRELEEALALAANRLARCSVEFETGSLQFIEYGEWAEEARALLSKQEGE